MYQQLDDMQTAVTDVSDVPVFGYTSEALNTDTGITGHNVYSDINANNIPLADGTSLSLQEMEKGFRDSISTLSKTIFTHFFGRSSYNTNKFKRLLVSVLGTYKTDYTHNFRMWDSTAVYAENDVCFLVAYGIRYCFKSLADNNTDTISASADGTLSYDDTKWLLLTEVRDVRHPVGEPFMWFGGTLPDNYICFSDGGEYTWARFPELNDDGFKGVLSRFGRYGAGYTATSFKVPVISELYPMSVSDLPAILSTIGAKVPAHSHALVQGTTGTTGTTSINHHHTMNSSNNAGSHTHYLGDYEPDGGRVSTSRAWHEDSKFDGAYEWQGTGDEHGNEYENYKIFITPTIISATHGNHAVTAPDETHAHTHSGVVKPSGAGDFGTATGKYRPGTVKVVLAVRAQ